MAMLQPAHRAAFDKWAAAAATALDAAPEEQLMKVLDEQLALLPAQVPFTTEELAKFDKYVEIYGKLLDSRDALLDLAGQGAVMSSSTSTRDRSSSPLSPRSSGSTNGPPSTARWT